MAGKVNTFRLCECSFLDGSNVLWHIISAYGIYILVAHPWLWDSTSLLIQTCILLICTVVWMFYLLCNFYFMLFLFLIARCSWPNFVCKGCHISSVVLYCINVFCHYLDVNGVTMATVGKWNGHWFKTSVARNEIAYERKCDSTVAFDSRARSEITWQPECRATVCCSSKYCIPHLKNGKNPHILNISPPLNMNPVWFKDHVGEWTLHQQTGVFIPFLYL